MSFGTGEKVGLAGGALLAAGIVTFLLLELWPKPDSEGKEEKAAGSAPVETRREEPLAPEPRAPDSAREVLELKKEVSRLRREVEKKDAEIERLKVLLKAAGATAEEEHDPAVQAEEALASLRACSSRTPSGDIRKIRGRLVTCGVRAVPAIRHSLESGEDVEFSDSWLYDVVDSDSLRFQSISLDRGIAAEGAVAADINADGRLDLVVNAGRTKNLVWYENRR